MTRLFHFSDDPAIAQFVPRPVRVPSARPPGREWLNGPLVWAIDEAHSRMYVFPRDCPRIVVWARPDTSASDRRRWLGARRAAVAFIERRRLVEFETAVLWRYDLPTSTFADLRDAGMWVSESAVLPLGVQRVDDLGRALEQTGTELRIVDSLLPLRDLWSTTLHASGIRLRNAEGWPGAD